MPPGLGATVHSLQTVINETTKHFRRDIPFDVKDPHLIPLEELYQEIGTCESGLTADVIVKRQKLCGPNELRVRTDVPIYMRFLRQFKNFFAILLIVGGLLAVLAERLDPGSGSIYIAIALFAVVLLNAIFTFVQEEQSERIMESFKKMLPSMVRVRRQGIVLEIEAKELVPGDIMLLYEGDKIPADGRLISSNELKVDLSSLTGESEPVSVERFLCFWWYLDTNSFYIPVSQSNNVFASTISIYFFYSSGSTRQGRQQRGSHPESQFCIQWITRS